MLLRCYRWSPDEKIPQVDADQSQIMHPVGSHVDGISTFTFSRPCVTDNAMDISLEAQDNYFFYAIGEVHFGIFDDFIDQHAETPVISDGFVPISCCESPS